jgi:RNA-splicing ligase RtcB
MLVRTSLPASAANKPRTLESWVDAVNLEGGWRGDSAAYLDADRVAPTDFDEKSLGTVGRGNDFAELQVGFRKPAISFDFSF